MNITVVGSGYVGLSNAVLLSQNHDVICFDINQERVNLINQSKSPIEDKEINDFLQHKSLRLRATYQPSIAYEFADFVIVATPTDYDPDTNYFDLLWI